MPQCRARGDWSCGSPANELARSRIQQQVQAVRLDSHPHIVIVLDLGQQQDQAYMVTNILGGFKVLTSSKSKHILAVL